MKKKIIKAKKLTLDIDKIYKNDFNLIKIMAQTKKMRNNNKTLEARKNNLKELMMEINNEYELNKNPSRKILKENNDTFKNEYDLFNKRTNKKETKTIFKDLVKLYKSKGYRIPNFSIETHNLFKINPLLEVNTEMISNGLLENQISKKNDDSEKIIRYLKKLGIILSGKMSTDPNLQKALMKKFIMPKFKATINEDDTVENLKKKIEIITNLINTNALSKLDEPKKRKYRNISRQNSYASMSYSNKKAFLLNKEKNAMSRRQSNYNNRVLNFDANKDKGNNLLLDRNNSNDSSNSNTSYASNYNHFNKKSNNEKSSESLNKIFNFTNYANNGGFKYSKTPKALNIPLINYQRVDIKRVTNASEKSSVEKKRAIKEMNNLSCKQNNVFNNNILRSNTINKNIFNYKSNSNNNNNRYLKGKLNNFPFFIKTQSNNDSNNSFSDEFFYDSKSPREISKNNVSLKDKKRLDSYNYPYSNKNEFINFAFNKFSKKSNKNAEKYIKNYLNKIKGYDNERIDIFVNDIYDRNIKNNIKDLEKQITDNDLYSKTERLYLNSHLIKRIKPLLKSMGERDKMIQRLEKTLTDAVVK